MDKGAATDDVKPGAAAGKKSRRRPTFLNAHARLRLFTGRADPAGRDEQYEKFYLILVEASPAAADFTVYEVGNPTTPIPMEKGLDDLLQITAERNPDFYEFYNGKLVKAS